MRWDGGGGWPAKGAHRLDRRLRVGQRVTDRLVFDDWDRPAAPLGAREGQRRVEGGTHQTDSEHADDRRPPGAAGPDQAPAAAHGADDVLPRPPYPLPPPPGPSPS